jgi:hypothetical protein
MPTLPRALARRWTLPMPKSRREKILASVKTTYEAAKFQPVKAPQDAYVWSLIASPGDFVRAGAPVATWVDCITCRAVRKSLRSNWRKTIPARRQA